MLWSALFFVVCMAWFNNSLDNCFINSESRLLGSTREASGSERLSRGQKIQATWESNIIDLLSAIKIQLSMERGECDMKL